MKPEKILGNILINKHLTVSTAESCTGGLVSSKLTDISGSSEYVKLNFVTYSNEAKHDILGVDWDILNTYGAVSAECAAAMADGLMKKTGCDVAICTTGIAGPTGGTEEKPVGLMYVAVKCHDVLRIEKVLLPSDTERVKMKEIFAHKALLFAISVLEQ